MQGGQRMLACRENRGCCECRENWGCCACRIDVISCEIMQVDGMHVLYRRGD
jgi:hypothetical protein